MNLELILQPNPLQCYYALGEADKKELYQLLLADNLEWGYSPEEAKKWADHQLSFLIDALTQGEEHVGDCTKVACSCTKCQAESVAGLSQSYIQGDWHMLQSAFNGSNDIFKAIEQLSKPVNFTYEVSQATVNLWNKKSAYTRSKLIDYYINWASQ
ncbi:MAG: hypothetical protein RSG77_14220 [Hafnia sp.]